MRFLITALDTAGNVTLNRESVPAIAGVHLALSAFYVVLGREPIHKE
jgi:hypothetical protein